MKFHLNHQPKKLPVSIMHTTELFFIGSCFSEHMYDFLKRSGFLAYSNPFGNTFNPLSLCTALETIVAPESTNKQHFVNRDGACHSLQAHSAIAAASADELEGMLQLKTLEANNRLKNASVLFVTFGTAWYYYHSQLQTVVANCHKLPQQSFEKRLALPQEIEASFEVTLQKLHTLNKSLKIVFTVSPVRHLKDGLEENYLSKSVLRLAIEQICRKHSNCYYFPAYELINDDLKDYRFYETDLAHPNKAAISYVEEKFANCFFDSSTNELALLYQKKHRLLQHRLLSNTSEAAQNHNTALEQINQLILSYTKANAGV